MTRIRHWGWGGLLICLVATLIAAYQAWLYVGDPLFFGDSGYRVFFAHRPVVKLGNRIWLPFLQLHVWLYHLLGLPASGVKLISAFYSWTALISLGFYWRRILGGSRYSTILAIFAAVCFAAQHLNVVTRPLMQEPIGSALFFGFLLFASRGAAFSAPALLCAAAALMTRDVYWIYLFAATLAGLPSLLADRRRLLAGVALWAVPILWLAVGVPAIYLVAFGRLPSIPIEWPLMYNPAEPAANPMSPARSLWIGLVDGRVLPLACGVAGAVAALALSAKVRFVQVFGFAEFSRTMVRAVPIALAVIYGLVLLVDPWQVTPGNVRAGWPLLEISFAVAPLLISASASAPPVVRTIVAAAILAGLAGGVDPQAIHGQTEENARIQAEQDRLTRTLSSAYPRGKPRVCIVAQLSWSVFKELGAPLFHERKTFVSWKNTLPSDCDVVIVEDGKGIQPPRSYRSLASITLPGRSWNAYSRP